MYPLFISVKSLLELSSLVRSIRIWQEEVCASSTLFNVDNVDWSQIIIDMFSRKMGTLFIYNTLIHKLPDYLPLQSVIALKDVRLMIGPDNVTKFQRLPMIDKKIKMFVSCKVNHSDLCNLNYTHNKFYVTSKIISIFHFHHNIFPSAGRDFMGIEHVTREKIFFGKLCDYLITQTSSE